MRAMSIVERDGRRELELRELPEPAPGPGQLKVRVRAAGVNRADLGRATQHYGHTPAATVPVAGLELAGEVVETGQGVTRFRPGDRVMSMAAGGYAEMALVAEDLAMPVPSGLSWEEAGAAPVVFLTAHDALVSNGRLVAGETVLVNAASSGAGIAALMIARAKGAGRVIASSTSAGKLAQLAGFGATATVVAGAGDYSAELAAAAGKDGVDVAVDHVGGRDFQSLIDAAAIRGRIVSVGRLGGVTAEINLDDVARKRLHLIGVTFRTRSRDEHAGVVSAFLGDLGPVLAEGKLRPPIAATFPLERAAEAQATLKTNAHLGKIVLLP